MFGVLVVEAFKNQWYGCVQNMDAVFCRVDMDSIPQHKYRVLNAQCSFRFSPESHGIALATK